MAPVGWVLAAALTSLGWVLPNHTRPWLAFHSDAWIALALACAAAVVLYNVRKVRLTVLDLLLAFVALLPLLQYGVGLIRFAGLAWISTAYLLGLLLAVLIGCLWHGWRPRLLGHYLFGSILLAAVVSVGLQIYQWLGFAEERGVTDIWVFSLAQKRPYANLGQPNLMATFALWGLVACGWARHAAGVRRPIAQLAAVFLVLGLAFTQSRAGLLGLFALVGAAWWWRGLWNDPRTPWRVSLLIPLYFAWTFAIQWMSVALLLNDFGNMIGRTVSEVRPALWAMMRSQGVPSAPSRRNSARISWTCGSL